MIRTCSPVGTFSSSSFIYENPTINRDKQAKGKKKNKHFLAWCAVHAFNKISGWFVFLNLKRQKTLL